MTLNTLTRFITILMVALCAPAGAMARVRGFSPLQLWGFAQGLSDMRARGEKLRYPGESLATVAARLDLHAWIAFDPIAALKHMARRHRGVRRLRMQTAAPPSFAPPLVWCAPLVRADAPVAFRDSS